ncbi:MAG: hypothetical protein CVT92_13185 [Bacteroidetes bacterium HGW-Bacteroidetes-1]|nr:MAG: hypothetical protein CVT92_13185 [Bacteroidetes bacterium HGW-Bacteroidetes-1]
MSVFKADETIFNIQNVNVFVKCFVNCKGEPDILAMHADQGVFNPDIPILRTVHGVLNLDIHIGSEEFLVTDADFCVSEKDV